MKTARALTLMVLVAVAAFVCGSWWTQRSLPPPSQGQQVLYYACPMHPQYHSDRAGDCPWCGMRLEPVYADGAGRGTWRGASALPAGAIHVDTERQQMIGVQLALAEKASGTRALRTTGRVAVDDNAVYPLVSGVEARIREVRSPTTGMFVRKNEVLAALYAPELLSSTQGYFIALNAVEKMTTQDANQIAAVTTNLQRAEEGLRNLGVSEGQIQELRTNRQPLLNITIASPVDGFILQRNVLVGQRVERGAELYRVADLRRVWIFADVYENQAPFVRAGMTVLFTVGRTKPPVRGDGERCASGLRRDDPNHEGAVEAENPGFTLKPGMFVDVTFTIDLPKTLAVPADAIVDTGLRKTLFVDRGNGFFEPRQVETGWRLGDLIEITERPHGRRTHRDLRDVPDRLGEPDEDGSARVRHACQGPRLRNGRGGQRRRRGRQDIGIQRHDLLFLFRRLQEEVRQGPGRVRREVGTGEIPVFQ